TRAGRFPVTVQDGHPVLPQRHIDADKPLRHGTPFARRRGTARISRTGATGREVSMAWSTVRDDGEPSPSILDECSRPGGRGATFSVDGCSRRSAEVPEIIRRSRPASGQTLTVPSSFRRGELPRRLRAPFARNVIPGAHAADRDRGRSRSESRAFAPWGRGTTDGEGVPGRYSHTGAQTAIGGGGPTESARTRLRRGQEPRFGMAILRRQ